MLPGTSVNNVHESARQIVTYGQDGLMIHIQDSDVRPIEQSSTIISITDAEPGKCEMKTEP